MPSDPVNKSALLQALEACECALTPQDVLTQSASVVLKGGYAHAMNNEMAVRSRTPLPDSIECAAHGRSLVNAVRNMPDDEVRVFLKGDELVVAGASDTSAVRADRKVLLPIDAVDYPRKGDWRQLPDEFGEALALVAECCKSNEQRDTFQHTCVHVTPKLVEATDQVRMAVHRMKLPFSSGFLIRASCAKAVARRQPPKAAEAGPWVHFRSGGVVMSVRKSPDDSYYDTTDFRSLDGRPVALPKSLVDAAKRLDLFSSEVTDDNHVTVELTKGRMRLKALGVHGRHTHRTRVDYDGPDVGFTVGPDTLAKLAERHSEVVVASVKSDDGPKVHLAATAGRYFFRCSMVVPSANGNGRKHDE